MLTLQSKAISGVHLGFKNMIHSNRTVKLYPKLSQYPQYTKIL